MDSRQANPHPLLAAIDSPDDLKKVPLERLPDLCQEIRDFIFEVVGNNGGHLAPNLGVVELTVALLYVFRPPADKIVWDVGHQCYPYKILTGRREAFPTLRQERGLSGFPRRSESPYDAFGAGHASTSISAALGLATARDMAGEDHGVVAVIGDGSLTGGLAYEGMNNLGISGRNILVILNDNEMSISPNVGAMTRYLARITSNPTYNRFKQEVASLLARFPRLGSPVMDLSKQLEKSLKSLVTPATLFDELGLRYFGPLDGHSLEDLITVLENIRRLDGPKLLHVLTKKGKGYPAAEKAPHRFHGVSPFNGKKAGARDPREGHPTYTEVLGQALVELGEERPEVIAITAAMTEGTGLTRFAARFPKRFFDVGIAEPHAVTFAAGSASGGLRPVVAIYSTFLQRAYDQLVHDVALQSLPVVLALDRGGLVGEDGPTHHGSLDISYLTSIPNMIVASPRSGRELRQLLRTALDQGYSPFAIRYPRDRVPDADWAEGEAPPLVIGSWEELCRGSEVALLASGSMVDPALEARASLAKAGLDVGVVNCRFLKPMDEPLLERLAKEYRCLVTLEENCLRGGFGQEVLDWLHRSGSVHSAIHSLGMPDAFVEHGSRRSLLEKLGLSAAGIERFVLELARIYGFASRRPSSLLVSATS